MAADKGYSSPKVEMPGELTQKTKYTIMFGLRFCFMIILDIRFILTFSYQVQGPSLRPDPSENPKVEREEN